jgi:hypothetical protein
MSSEIGTQLSEEYIGWWFRADSYEVSLTQHIHATPGGKIERYNPWEGFQLAGGKSKRGGGTLLRPYVSLIEIVDTFDHADKTRSGFAHLDPEMFPVVRNWYREHGCLGLFLTKVREVKLYPRWESLALGANSRPTSHSFPTFSHHVRTPTGWTRRRFHSLSNERALLLPADQRPEGGLVQKELWTPEWRPGVLIETPDGFAQETIQEFMNKFFPTIPEEEQETYCYPLPLSESFWGLYSESVGDFLNAARSFSRAVRSLARFRPIEEMDDVEHHFIATAYHELMYLASQVNPLLRLNKDGTCSREWVCTSLLASYAMMVLLDVERGALNLCAKCNRVFTSSAGRARFCSAKCRRTQLQRESRARKKTEESHSSQANEE